MDKYFSLICVTHGRLNELKRLLDSLMLQIQNFELILIDQNTTNLLDELVSNYSERIKINHQKVAYNNLSKARNFGVSYAKGKIICFPDDDCWYPDTLLFDLEKYFTKNDEIKLLCTNWVDPVQQPSISMFSGPNGKFTKNELFESASSICIFVDREIFLKSGGFNVRMGLGTDTIAKAGEDQEILLRINEYSPAFKNYNLCVYHPIGHRAWNEYFEKRILSSGASDFYIKKHYFSKKEAYKDLATWFLGALFNAIRMNKRNFKWYFLKLKGAITLSNKI